MLSAEENRRLTRVGSGTPMGEVMRRYWLPALLSSELLPDGDPRRVSLLGERLVAFRDTEGRVGVLDENCPHRGASLALGINAGCGLRCLYHGWKVGYDGRIQETPSEPETSTFRQRIRHVAYPVREAAGIVWAYLGPLDRQPELPSFEWTALDPSHVCVQKVVQDCNWAQSVEGAIDSAHIGYLHSDVYGVPDGVDIPGVRDAVSGFPGRTADGRPRLEIDNTDYGFVYAAVRTPREDSALQRHVRISHFVAPFYGQFPGNDLYDDDHGNLQAFVPMNDHETMQYYILYDRTGPLTEPIRAELAEVDEAMGIDADCRRRANRGNNWLQDREMMRRGESGTGLGTVADEDMAIQESMGPIYDRTREHLGTSDVAVIRMRRIMLAAARQLEENGAEPPGVAHGRGLTAIRSVDRLAPIEEPWQTYAFHGSPPLATGEAADRA
jgi:phthalate 4,5-dioxygenase